MIIPLAFWLFLLGALAIGWHAGDRKDHAVLLAILGAALFTAVAQFSLDFLSSRIAATAVNLALLLFMWRYAFASQRFWPLWFVGIHATATAFGMLAVLSPEGKRWVFSLAEAILAIPALLVMVIGLLADQRHGITNRPD